MKTNLKSSEIVTNIEQCFSPDVCKVFELCGLGYIKVKPSHKAKKEKLLEALLWMGDFSVLVQNYQSVRSLHTELAWGNFFGMFKQEMSDAEEVVRLNEKKEQLIRYWKQRPGVLRKTRSAEIEAEYVKVIKNVSPVL